MWQWQRQCTASKKEETLAGGTVLAMRTWHGGDGVSVHQPHWQHTLHTPALLRKMAVAAASREEISCVFLRTLHAKTRSHTHRTRITHTFSGHGVAPQDAGRIRNTRNHRGTSQVHQEVASVCTRCASIDAMRKHSRVRGKPQHSRVEYNFQSTHMSLISLSVFLPAYLACIFFWIGLSTLGSMLHIRQPRIHAQG